MAKMSLDHLIDFDFDAGHKLNPVQLKQPLQR